PRAAPPPPPPRTVLCVECPARTGRCRICDVRLRTRSRSAAPGSRDPGGACSRRAGCRRPGGRPAPGSRRRSARGAARTPSASRPARAGGWVPSGLCVGGRREEAPQSPLAAGRGGCTRSEEHTSELQSRFDLVCRLLLEKKKTKQLSKSIIYPLKLHF